MAAWTCAALAQAATYTTYIGDTYSYQVSAIATDAAGNTFVTGNRIIAPPSPQNTYLALTDIFVCKIDAAGHLTRIATFSGKGTDQANSIAVDPAGNIYIAGATTSVDFPLLHPLQPAGPLSLQTMGFLMKLAPDGAIVYSTFLGGTQGYSTLRAVAVDAQGNAYVTGETSAADYQHTPGLPAATVSTTPVEYISAAFFAKINAGGTGIVYAGAIAGSPGCGATCQGGSADSSGNAIAVDSSGNAYIGGTAGGTLGGTPGALRAQGAGAFVLKIDSSGTGLQYLTPLGTVKSDTVAVIAVNAAGNAYVTGVTSDPSFPVTPGALQTSLPGTSGSSSFFVAELNPAGTALVWATYLGSTSNTTQSMALSPSGEVWVSGAAEPASLPVTVTLDANGPQFLAEIDPTGSSLVYAARFPADTVSAALRLDAAATLHAAGDSGLITAFPADSPPGPSAAPWIAGVANSASGPLTGRIAPGELISIYGQHIGPAAPAQSSFDAQGFLPTALSGFQVTVNGTPAPLLYVSDTQINLVAPIELSVGSDASLQIVTGGSTLAAMAGTVVTAAPGVFPVVINQDGTLNSATNPAPASSYVSVWATGTGYFPGSDGQMATAANSFCAPALIVCDLYSAFQSELGGEAVPVSYSGAAPGTVNGLVQINFQVSFPEPPFGYYLSVGGIASPHFEVSSTSSP